MTSLTDASKAKASSMSAKIFKYVRDVVTNDPIYKKMRKLWRENESE